MKKIILLFSFFVFSFGFQNAKIENLIGTQNFQIYNKLLQRIFVKKNLTIVEILQKLENNGLLNLFFNKAKLIHTRVIFNDNDYMFDTKILHDSLLSLGYYYFYPSEITKTSKFYSLNIEFKSEHFIDPLAFIKDMKSRGCEILDVSKNNNEFEYKFNCDNPIIKNAKTFTNKIKRFINARGIYWLKNNDFNKIYIRTMKIDYWHPSIWFYDDNLNLLNNVKLNQKTSNITLDIPASCKYIKITDIYSAENFKRGIFVKGLK